MEDKKEWSRSFTVTDNGFYGHLYLPEEDLYKGKAVIVIGGGGMPYNATLAEAKAFCGMGISALALGYYGVPETPKTLVKVPIEYVRNAARWLHDNEYGIVVSAGISKGAELALISATYFDEINGVIAFSPAARIYMGIGKGKKWVKASSWTYEDKELPYAYAEYPKAKVIGGIIAARELTFIPVYEKADSLSGDDSIIPVEKIKGPVLVCAALEDSLWPSKKACDLIINRLEEHDFKYQYKKLVYQYASHILLPFSTGYDKFFRMGRKHPEKCRETAATLYKEVEEWLHKL